MVIGVIAIIAQLLIIIRAIRVIILNTNTNMNTKMNSDTNTNTGSNTT